MSNTLTWTKLPDLVSSAPLVDVPGEFTHDAIAIRASTTNPYLRRTAGSLYQWLQVENQRFELNERHQIPYNSICICRLQPLVQSYRLRFESREIVSSYKIEIWEPNMFVYNPGEEISFPDTRASSVNETEVIVGNTTPVQLIAPNPARRGLVIVNVAANIVFVDQGASVSATDFTARLATNGIYQVPANYTGAMCAIASTGASNKVLVKEFV
jgi:hypothetical protein